MDVSILAGQPGRRLDGLTVSDWLTTANVPPEIVLTGSLLAKWISHGHAMCISASAGCVHLVGHRHPRPASRRPRRGSPHCLSTYRPPQRIMIIVGEVLLGKERYISLFLCSSGLFFSFLQGYKKAQFSSSWTSPFLFPHRHLPFPFSTFSYQ